MAGPEFPRLSEDPDDYSFLDSELAAVFLETACLENAVADCLESGEFGELSGLFELLCALESRVYWVRYRAVAEKQLDDLLGE